MSSGKHYIPRADADFYVWTTNFTDNLGELQAALHFPAEAYAHLQALHSAFKRAYEVALAPGTRTKVTVVKKNMARKALEKAVRQAVNEYLNTHLMTNPIRDQLGLPIHDPTPTPSHVAATPPFVRVAINNIRILVFHFFGSDTSRAKLPGQYAMEIAWVISATRPTSLTELIHSRIATRTPLVLEFGEQERGGTLWFATRWVNTRGLPGPWSEIRSAIVP